MLAPWITRPVGSSPEHEGTEETIRASNQQSEKTGRVDDRDSPGRHRCPGQDRPVAAGNGDALSENGNADIVTVLSTADAEYGTDFGAMMVLLAGSITFDTVVHQQFTLAL
ncbi:hypothetical protein NN3_04560 [Nocardia neocaledoniensis NBRC 108232]|nr:hypothetical protein NN3_04560 [Nocardia neocaledoniensis NBRC 108232]